MGSGLPINTYDYVVLVYDSARNAPTFRNSLFFAIGPVPTGNCGLGSYSSTGQHPCTLCPTGTYSLNTTYCQPCPTNTTTLDLGSKSKNDCSVNITNPLYAFTKTAGSFLVGSNAAGTYIENHESRVSWHWLWRAAVGCAFFFLFISAPFPVDFSILVFSSQLCRRWSSAHSSVCTLRVKPLMLVTQRSSRPVTASFLTIPATPCAPRMSNKSANWISTSALVRSPSWTRLIPKRPAARSRLLVPEAVLTR